MSNTPKGNNNVRFLDGRLEQLWVGVLPSVPSQGDHISFHNRGGLFQVSEVVWGMNHYGCSITVYVEEV